MANSLASSVSSLQSSVGLLDSSINILDNGINDFPRLSKVLQTTRHFELLPEPTLREAQKSLLDEITPSIAHLFSLASNHIDKLERREQALKARCDLQEGRLSHDETTQSSRNRSRERKPRLTTNTLDDASGRAAELRKLVQKKERLKYTGDRLELQSKQKQRELRKSMAVQ